jgi:hypothetical protein
MGMYGTVKPEERSEGSAGPLPAAEGAARSFRLSRDLVREFLRRLLGYVKSRKLYPSGHARPAAQLEAWHGAVGKILEFVEELTLYVEPDALVIAGDKLSDREPFVAELNPELIRRLVRFVAIARGVTAGELGAFAEVLLLDPEELKERGGARSVIAASRVARVAVIEFSYDMARYVEDASDLALVRTLARWDGVGTPEGVLGQFAEQQLTSGERRVLKELVADAAVQEKLAILGVLMGRGGGAAEGTQTTTRVRVSDVLLLLVRELGTTSADGAARTQTPAQEVSALLDKLKTDLASASARASAAAQESLLSSVAGTLFGSRAAVEHWVAGDRVRSVGANEGNPEALKAIFSRTETAARNIRLGASLLETLQAPPSPPVVSGGVSTATVAPVPKRVNPPTEVGLAEVVRGLNALPEKCGGGKIQLQRSKMLICHKDILLELLTHEQDPGAREGIVRRLAAFLGKNLEAGADMGSMLMASIGDADHATLHDADRTVLIEEPAVCAWALGRLIDFDDSAWHVPLRALAKRARAVFAHAFGTLILSRNADVSAERLEEFCPLCDEDLCEFLASKVDGESRSGRLERIVKCALACCSAKATLVMRRLLPRVGADDRQKLICRLVEFDSRESLGALSLALAQAEPHVRKTIIKMLGYSANAMAEEILVDRVREVRAGKMDFDEQLACLASLRRVGTARCVSVVRGVAGDWRLLLSAKGREARSLAKLVAATVQARLEKRPVLNEEARDGQ